MFVHSSVTYRSCKIVERPLMKPNCLLLIRPLAFMWATISSLISESWSLHRIHVRLTGRYLLADCFFLEYRTDVCFLPDGWQFALVILNVKICCSDLVMTWLISLTILGCNWSGPGDLDVLSVIDFFLILSSVKPVSCSSLFKYCFSVQGWDLVVLSSRQNYRIPPMYRLLSLYRQWLYLCWGCHPSYTDQEYFMEILFWIWEMSRTSWGCPSLASQLSSRIILCLFC